MLQLLKKGTSNSRMRIFCRCRRWLEIKVATIAHYKRNSWRWILWMTRWHRGPEECIASSMPSLITHNCRSSPMTSSKYLRPWRVSQLRNLHNCGKEQMIIQSSLMMHLSTLPLTISSTRTFVSARSRESRMVRASRIEHRPCLVELPAPKETMGWTGIKLTNSNSETKEISLRRELRHTKTKSRESNCSKKGRHRENDI